MRVRATGDNFFYGYNQKVCEGDLFLNLLESELKKSL